MVDSPALGVRPVAWRWRETVRPQVTALHERGGETTFDQFRNQLFPIPEPLGDYFPKKPMVGLIPLWEFVWAKAPEVATLGGTASTCPGSIRRLVLSYPRLITCFVVGYGSRTGLVTLVESPLLLEH